MTKVQTVELLQKQLPGFYSVDQVIKIINDIEEDGQAQAYNEDQVEELIEGIESSIKKKISAMDSDELVDEESAEFELHGNEISLYSVPIDDKAIAEECTEVVREKLSAFLKAPELQVVN